MKWYVVHTQTGCENRIRESLVARAASQGKESMFGEVLIPTEQVSEVKDGQKRITERKFYPGYVLIEMDLTDETWYIVKNTPGISGFVGSGNKPIPLAANEVKAIVNQQEEKKTKPQPKVIFEIGESVRVKEGAFANFNGTIEEVNPHKGKLKVMVTIFGRATPVELEYWQVEKL
jgi:transcriptional antiterminator NusG